MPPQLEYVSKRGQKQAIKGKKLGTQYIFHNGKTRLGT